jgi:nucleoside-diphosphate-sugar epimerase
MCFGAARPRTATSGAGCKIATGKRAQNCAGQHRGRIGKRRFEVEVKMTEPRLAVVAGGLGVIGHAVAEHLASRGGWEVVSVSRRKGQSAGKARHAQIDLLDAAATKAGLAKLGKPTHLFFAALMRADPQEQVDLHVEMLRNFVNGAAAASSLRRVVLYEGAMYYGSYLGPFKTPAIESDPRVLPPNFYYSMEDWLFAESKGKSWDAVVIRPDLVCTSGFMDGHGFNIALLIAVYATICKELGIPLRYPGSAAAYRSLAQVTDSAHLAHASEWAAIEAPAGEAFNVANGDFFRWEQLWEMVARFFEMPLGNQQQISLTTLMKDKGPLWQSIVRKYGLAPHPYDALAYWPAGDFVLNCGYDVMTSTVKARKAGFHGVVDTWEMFERMFTGFRRQRLIP